MYAEHPPLNTAGRFSSPLLFIDESKGNISEVHIAKCQNIKSFY